jgi:hypothetical protein
LVPPGEANPRGFFESQEIVTFHQKVLQRLRGSADADDPSGTLLQNPELNQEERAEALLILGHLAKPGVWGWKDPRTIHFIEFWLSLLPGAKLIVPLRHPLEHLYSYLKKIGRLDHLIGLSRILNTYAEYHQRIHQIVHEREKNSLVLYAQNAFCDPTGLSALLEHFLDLGRAGPPVRESNFVQSEFSRLRLHRCAMDLFRMSYPDAAFVFDRLNDRAEFRLLPEDPSPEIRDSFHQLCAVVGRTRDCVSRESWLPVILDLCRPDDSPGYFGLQSEILSRHGEAERFWKTQFPQLQAALDSYRMVNSEQASWIAQLEEAKKFAQSQAASYLQQLESQKAANRDHARRIAELEKAKESAGSQSASHLEELDKYRALNREQGEPIIQLEKARET